MMSHFKKGGVIFTLSVFSLVFIAVIVKFTVLAFGPRRKLIPPAPVVERGSIVDRNGKPLAVQTNFYHLVVTPKLIKDPAFFAKKIIRILCGESFF